MRTLLLLTAILMTGCATQPTTAAKDGETRPAATDAQRLAMARNLNLKAVNKDGQQVFCRSNYQTASRIAMDTTCYTADELQKLEDRQQRELDQLNTGPGRLNTMPTPGSH